jgi:hypothetical protein
MVTVQPGWLTCDAGLPIEQLFMHSMQENPTQITEVNNAAPPPCTIMP